MSERKVLNKYYPPEFDPNNIPKLRQEKNRQWNIRIMAPFNMRCGTCGEYIYKGKKFNSRKEDVEDDDYLGLKIFRFYIKCPRCVAEISFKTDPKNTDYELEAGATRNFEPLKTAETLARRELEEKEAEEKNNPMKVLENRTKASRQEMEMIETLEDLKQLNARHATVDHTQMISMHAAYEKKLQELQEQKDEEFIKSLFGKDGHQTIKRLYEEEEAEEAERKLKKNDGEPPSKKDKPTNILTDGSKDDKGAVKSQHTGVWTKSIGSLSSSKSKLGNLVRKKAATATSSVAPTQSHSAKSEIPDTQIVGKSSTNKDTESASSDKITSTSDAVGTSGKAASGLGLLGAYSDSEENSESD